MGQKVHPNAIRLGVNKAWKANWYADKSNYSDRLIQDVQIRKLLDERLRTAGLADVIIKRYSSKLEINIFVARPGVVIGKGGSGIEALKKEMQQKFGKNINLKVLEVKKPEISAELVSDNIRSQLERRIVPKFACQRAIEAAQNTNSIKGIRIWVSGRIKGAEIARTEKFQWGTVPLSTMRAHIDFDFKYAQVPNAGKHGIKVWVYHGEKFNYDIAE